MRRPLFLRDTLSFRLLIIAALLGGFIIQATPALAQQTGVVRGTVLSEDSGQPLEGAIVRIRNSDLGAFTDGEGSFRIIEVPAGTHRLDVDLIGYASATRTVEVPAGASVEVEISLRTSAMRLAEIVVTGTGEAVERRRIGNVVTSVDVSEVSTPAVTNISELLSSEAAGLKISRATGAVGDASKLRLRETTSITQANDPVVYIDGVRLDNSTLEVSNAFAPARLDDIHPEDIQRIEVLKGPAAATLLGSEAAPGVMQIFTKKGSRGEPVRVNLSASVGFEDFRENRVPFNGAFVPSTGEILTNRPSVSELVRTPVQQDYTISASGGLGEGSFYVSGHAEIRPGAVFGNGLDRFSARANGSVPVTERGNLDYTFSFINSDLETLDNRFTGTGPFGVGLYANPANVRPGFPFGEAFTPIPAGKTKDDVQKLQRVLGSLSVRQPVGESLRLSATVGADAFSERNIEHQTFGFPFFGVTRGRRNLQERTKRTFTVDGRASFSEDILGWLSTNIVVGVQGFGELSSSTLGRVDNFPGPGVEDLGQGSSLVDLDEFNSEEINGGIFGETRFSLGERLHLIAGLRADGTSTTPGGFDPELLPKGSISYELSEESFWRDGSISNLISSLRLRAAVGWASQNPRPFDADRTFLGEKAPGGEIAITPGSAGNPDLSAERSRGIEAGADIGLFNERMGVTLTYFHQETKDALLERRFAPSEGFVVTQEIADPSSSASFSQLVNLGEIESEGVEVELHNEILNRPSFGWDLATSFQYVDNKVVDLGDVEPFGFSFLTPTRWFIREGLTPGAIFASTLDPSDPFDTTVPIEELSSVSQVTPNILKASSGQDSSVFLGNPIPDFRIKFQNNFSVLADRLRMRVTGTANFGGDFVMVNTTEIFRGALGGRFKIAEIERELRDPNTSTARREELALIAAQENPGVPGNFVEPSNFLRLEEISVSYRFPSGIVDVLPFEAFSATGVIRDPALWSNYPGLAYPGTSFSGRAREGSEFPAWVQNGDFFQVPMPRRFMLVLRGQL